VTTHSHMEEYKRLLNEYLEAIDVGENDLHGRTPWWLGPQRDLGDKLAASYDRLHPLMQDVADEYAWNLYLKRIGEPTS